MASCRVSPFGNPRITARLTAPRGISQPPTSFIGSWCQGIHRAPLLTWPQRCSRPLCSSQRTDDPTPTPGHTHKGSFTEDMVRTAASPRTLNQRGPGGSMATEEASAPSGPNSAPYKNHPPARPPVPPPPRKKIGSTRHKPGRRQPLEVSVPRQ